MEHYKKKHSIYIDDPLRPNELKVTGAGKSHDLSNKAAGSLKEHAAEGIYVSAVGSHVTKAVTVVEMLKRKIQGLQQTTTIKYARVEDIWEPDMEGLDSLKVTRKIPSISVHLLQLPSGPGKSKVAESADTASPPTRPPSSGKTRRKRGRSRSDQDRPPPSSGHTEEVPVCPDGSRTEGDGLGQLSELKLLETVADAELAKGHSSSGGGGKGRGGRSGQKEGAETQVKVQRSKSSTT